MQLKFRGVIMNGNTVGVGRGGSSLFDSTVLQQWNGHNHFLLLSLPNSLYTMTLPLFYAM